MTDNPIKAELVAAGLYSRVLRELRQIRDFQLAAITENGEPCLEESLVLGLLAEACHHLEHQRCRQAVAALERVIRLEDYEGDVRGLLQQLLANTLVELHVEEFGVTATPAKQEGPQPPPRPPLTTSMPDEDYVPPDATVYIPPNAVIKEHGHYSQNGVVALLRQHKGNPAAVQFIADMLER